MELIKIEQNQETMSSTQLAEMLKQQKKHINEAIKKMFHDKIDGRIIRPCLDSRGYVIEYHLPELESKMFVAKKDIGYLEKVVQFWIDKNKQHQIPQTYSETLQLAADLAKKNEQLEQQKQLDAPKVAFANTIENSQSTISIGAFAKLTGKIGRNKLFFHLRKNKIFMHNNQPYQKYIDSGYFEVSESVIQRTNGDQIIITPYITGRGQVYISKKIDGWCK